ncbi:hypothetical protein BGX26_011131 [Mortierella sp. AD094]|nr:hypothetical protein BGX26_011131 [Mortierella sp. AD094]
MKDSNTSAVQTTNSVKDFCQEIQALTSERYQKALNHCIATAASTSQACDQIYRNWHPEDLQRMERQLECSPDTRYLLAYPAEKYALVRKDDHSPTVNPFFNMLGLFFCATQKQDGGPIQTSPYGKTRYQVSFDDLQQTLFPSFQLYFADHYTVVEDWYIQLVVVPSWNHHLESQCVQQGLIKLDIDANPFFFRASHSGDPDSLEESGLKTSLYRVCNSPKLWVELLIGCDVIPTSSLGEVVECSLHKKVRRTANFTNDRQQREQYATIVENLANDLRCLSQELRQESGSIEQNMTELAVLSSVLRTRLGFMLSSR